MAVTIYCVWQERNARVFQQVYKDVSAVMSEIQNYVVGRTWYWKCKRTYVNWLICNEWGINESVLM